MPNYPLDQSGEIFIDLAEKYGSSPITDHDTIAALLDELQARLGGWVILDFLDMSNWDKIEAYELDRESGVLSLTWHDYRTIAESAGEREVREMVFPASYYGSALHIKSIVPLSSKNVAVFVLNGYSKTEKEILKLYREGAEEIKLLDSSFFEKRVVKRSRGHIEVVDFHCTPIFSLAIVPKKCGLGSHHSKELLYSYNFQLAVQRLNGLVSALDAMPATQHDEIAEKVNTARRIMEFVLKVECCSRELKLSKNYSQVLLGDLIGQVKPLKDVAVQSMLGKFAELANEFSHDSGKPLDLAKAKVAAMFALAYAMLVELEHRS